MKKFQILLISDMCVSNGEGFGNVVDTDVSYDNYGIPVIKGKSLKGALRVAAEELSDYGLLSGEQIDSWFGVKGAEREGRLTVNDAHPVDYKEYINDIAGMMPVPDISQVLECFTYVRTQTSLESDTGTAKRNSLRTIRVINRGIKFNCCYKLDGGTNDEYKLLENCIHILRRIGRNKTRGLGEVKCIPLETEADTDNISYSEEAFEEGNKLQYTIELLSPAIPAKENEDMSFIPGSTFEGLCFRNIGSEKMRKYLEGGLRFSNALLSADEKRFFSAPAFFAKQKKAIFNKNKKMNLFIFDTQKCKEAEPPAMPVKSAFFSISDNFNEILAASPVFEINTHHKQSEDDPGVVEEGFLYQLTSLSAGQTFTGTVNGKPEMLSDIYSTIGAESEQSIGYYRAGGYGRCLIKLKKLAKTSCPEVMTDRIAVCLVSPAVLYDDNAMPSANPAVFYDYLKELLAKDNIKIKSVTNKYLRFTTVGGYNVSWNMSKQRFQALAAGTVFVCELDTTSDISELKDLCIGERTAEGFGELRIFDYNAVAAAGENELTVTAYEKTIVRPETPGGFISESIMRRRQNEILKRKAIKKAKSTMQNSVNPTQIGRLMLMCMENDCYGDFIKAVSEIKDKNKRERAMDLIAVGNEESELFSESALYKVYYRTLFTEIKYLLRMKKVDPVSSIKIDMSGEEE